MLKQLLSYLRLDDPKPLLAPWNINSKLLYGVGELRGAIILYNPTGNIRFDSSLQPNADITHDIGASTRRVRNIYVQSILGLSNLTCPTLYSQLMRPTANVDLAIQSYLGATRAVNIYSYAPAPIADWVINIQAVGGNLKFPRGAYSDSIDEYTVGTGVYVGGVWHNAGIIPDSAYPNALLRDGSRTSLADQEFENSLNGTILRDRTTGTRYRLYVDNGVLGIEAA